MNTTNRCKRIPSFLPVESREALSLLLKQIATAPDETAARWVFSTYVQE